MLSYTGHTEKTLVALFTKNSSGRAILCNKLMEETDFLDPNDKHYCKRKADLDDRLYKMYDKIEDTETLLSKENGNRSGKAHRR